MKKDDRCPATNRDGERCGHPAGWGTDHVGEGCCKHHGGAGGDVGDSGGAPTDEENGSYEHGGFSEALPEDAEDVTANIAAFRDAVDTDSLDPVWVHLAGEAFARYRRSEDSRHLAECRRCLENAGDGDETVELGDIEVVADFA
jgi:hypothetical protein